MSNKDFHKAQQERSVFKEFAERCPLDIAPHSIETGSDPPDIFCQFNDGESVGFELKELCYSETAKAISDQLKGRPDALTYIREGDLRELIRRSLKKQYKTDRPIELLFYLDGQSARPPDTLAGEIRAWSDGICHHYRRVWFMGQLDERCGCAWSCPSQWPDKNWADPELFGPCEDAEADFSPR